MAENETLDICKSPRWIPVCRLILQGKPTAQVQREIRRCLAASWKAVQRQFKKHGFTLDQVGDAAIRGDRAFLDRAYRESKYHRFVRLIEGSCGFMTSPGEVLERAVKSQLRCVSDQIRDTLVAKGHCTTVTQADGVVYSAFEAIRSDATTLARNLVEAPRYAAQLIKEWEPGGEIAGIPLTHSLLNPAMDVAGLHP